MGTAPPGSYENVDALDAASAPTDQSVNPDSFVPTNSEIITQSQVIQFVTNGVQPPTVAYSRSDDLWRLECFNFNPALTGIEAHVRLLTPDGQIHDEVISLQGIPSNGATVAIDTQLAEGFVLSALLVATGNVVCVRGQTASVLLVRRPNPPPSSYQTLWYGYYVSAGNLCFPPSRVDSLVDGRGWLTSVAVAQPGVGVELSVAVPAGVRWRVVGMRATLTASAAVAARAVAIQVSDGANLYYTAGAVNTIAAGQTGEYTFAPDVTAAVDTVLHFTIPAPPLESLPAGHTISTSTAGLQAGDQWSAAHLLVEQWIEG
jgi:hypothetical protein